MANDGKDYNHIFGEACSELMGERDQDLIRGKFELVVLTLWKAIRSVFFYYTVITGAFATLPIGFFIRQEGQMLVAGIVSIVILLLIAVPVYWLLRLIFYFEISRYMPNNWLVLVSHFGL